MITSVQNAWVKSLKRLHHSSVRTSERRFLVEGPHLLDEAIATDWPLEAVCFDATWEAQNQGLLSRLLQDTSRSSMILQPVSTEVLRRLSTTDSPCSVVGVAVLPPPAAFPSAPLSLALAVESLQDPGNLGSLIRITAGAGIGPVILGAESVDATNSKVLRASAGQWFRQPPMTGNLVEILRIQRQANVQVLAASAEGVPFWECDLTAPTIFLLGNEGSGLSQSMRNASTSTIAVPMAAGVESMNVAVIGALLAYEAKRQRANAVKHA